jgi:hypothetical protein
MKKDNSITIVQPEAAPVIASALATLTGAHEYAASMISEEFQLAAQIAELKKTETVLQAMNAEFTRKRMDFERRQAALSTSRSGANHGRW